MISGFCFFNNEAAILQRTIPTWLPFLDELVLADTGSSDGSLELAVKLTEGAEGLRVVVANASWQTDMDWSGMTNSVMGLCSQSWALRLDADEALDGNPSAFRSLMRNYEALCARQEEKCGDVLPVAVGGLLINLLEPETGYTCYRSRLHRHIEGWRYHYRLDPVPRPPQDYEGGVFIMVQDWIIKTVHLRSSVREGSLKRAEGVLELAQRLDGPLDEVAIRHYKEAIDRAKLYSKEGKNE